MTIEMIRELHNEATTARNDAYQAYNVALAHKDGTSRAAYTALLSANRVRDMIYSALIKAVTQSAR